MNEEVFQFIRRNSTDRAGLFVLDDRRGAPVIKVHLALFFLGRVGHGAPAVPACHKTQEEHFIFILFEGFVGLAVTHQNVLNAVPKLFVCNNRLLLPVENVLFPVLVLEPDFPDIKMIRQNVRDLFLVEFCASGSIFPSDVEFFGPIAHFVELFGDLPHGGQLGVKLKAELHDLGFFLMDHKFLFFHDISKRDKSSAPHASFGHGKAFVVSPLL
ncbi:MAG: hypothetical protein V1673_05830 [Candidatus Omnitrophota bacterium]